jgi:hypothetical protein
MAMVFWEAKTAQEACEERLADFESNSWPRQDGSVCRETSRASLAALGGKSACADLCIV